MTPKSNINEFVMARLMLSDELWSKLKEIMLGHQIYNKPNLRTIVEAMLYRMRVGCPALGETYQQILDAGIPFINNSIVGRQKTS